MKRLLLLALLFAAPAFAGERAIYNPEGTGDLKIKRNTGTTGSPVFEDAGVVAGTTGLWTIGASGSTQTHVINGNFSLVGTRGVFPNGTSTAPSITFQADTTTGFSRSNANTLDFITGGTNAMQLSGANLGIGGNTLSATLAVNPSVDNQVGIAIDASTTNRPGKLRFRDAFSHNGQIQASLGIDFYAQNETINAGGYNSSGQWIIGPTGGGVVHSIIGSTTMSSLGSATPSTAGTIFYGTYTGQTNLGIIGVTNGNNGFTLMSRSSTDSSGGVGIAFMTQKLDSSALAVNAPFKFINGSTSIMQADTGGAWTIGPSSGSFAGNHIRGVNDASSATQGDVGEYQQIQATSAAFPGTTTNCGTISTTVNMTAGEFICGVSHGNTTGGITSISACVSPNVCVGSAFSADCVVGQSRTTSGNSGELSASIGGVHIVQNASWVMHVEVLSTFTTSNFNYKAYCVRIR